MRTSELRERRTRVLGQWDVAQAGKKMDTLKARIAKGQIKTAGLPAEHESRLKLATLADELRRLELELDVPAEVCDWAYHFAELLGQRNLPAGSVLVIRIPGSINLEVDLVNDEPPF